MSMSIEKPLWNARPSDRDCAPAESCLTEAGKFFKVQDARQLSLT